MTDEQIEAAAKYLAERVVCTTWDGLRKDGKASDNGFKPFLWKQMNARQEDFRDAVRGMLAAANIQIEEKK